MKDNPINLESITCSNRTCTGVIGSKGNCTKCGKTYIAPEVDVTQAKVKTLLNKSNEEDSFKCRNCGFVEYGDDPSILKNMKCWGCGSVMGEEPIKQQSSTMIGLVELLRAEGEEPIKQQSSTISTSLLDACQKCNHQFSKRAFICPKCNQERTSECFICKKHIPVSSNCCPECGDPRPFKKSAITKLKNALTSLKNMAGMGTYTRNFQANVQAKQHNQTDEKTPTSQNDLTCQMCGADVSDDMLECEKCGEPNKDYQKGDQQYGLWRAKQHNKTGEKTKAKNFSWKLFLVAYFLATFLNAFIGYVADVETRNNNIWTTLWIYYSIDSWKYWGWKALIPYPLFIVISLIIIVLSGIGRPHPGFSALLFTANFGGLILFYVLRRKSRKEAAK